MTDTRDHVHEMLNKLAVLTTNFEVLQQWLSPLRKILDKTEKDIAISPAGSLQKQGDALDPLEIAYINEELPALVRESSLCVDQLRDVVMGLREMRKTPLRNE